MRSGTPRIAFTSAEVILGEIFSKSNDFDGSKWGGGGAFFLQANEHQQTERNAANVATRLTMCFTCMAMADIE